MLHINWAESLADDGEPDSGRDLGMSCADADTEELRRLIEQAEWLGICEDWPGFPIVQSEGGQNHPAREYLRELAAICWN